MLFRDHRGVAFLSYNALKQSRNDHIVTKPQTTNTEYLSYLNTTKHNPQNNASKNRRRSSLHDYSARFLSEINKDFILRWAVSLSFPQMCTAALYIPPRVHTARLHHAKSIKPLYSRTWFCGTEHRWFWNYMSHEGPQQSLHAAATPFRPPN